MSAKPVNKEERMRLASQTTLAVLRKKDKHVTDLLVSATHVATYKMANNAWVRMEIEGPLHIVRRDTQPSCKMIVLNRKGMEDLHETLVPGQVQLEVADSMIMYKVQKHEIRGVWFYEREDCNAVLNVLQTVLHIERVPHTIQEKNVGAGEANLHSSIANHSAPSYPQSQQQQQQQQQHQQQHQPSAPPTTTTTVGAPVPSQVYYYPTQPSTQYPPSTLPPDQQHMLHYHHDPYHGAPQSVSTYQPQQQQQQSKDEGLERFFPGISIGSNPGVSQQNAPQHSPQPQTHEADSSSQAHSGPAPLPQPQLLYQQLQHQPPSNQTAPGGPPPSAPAPSMQAYAAYPMYHQAPPAGSGSEGGYLLGLLQQGGQAAGLQQESQQAGAPANQHASNGIEMHNRPQYPSDLAKFFASKDNMMRSRKMSQTEMKQLLASMLSNDTMFNAMYHEYLSL